MCYCTSLFRLSYQSFKALYVLLTVYTGWPKKLAQLFVCRFKKLFDCQNQKKIGNNTITKIPPNFKCVATLPCEISSVLKAN